VSGARYEVEYTDEFESWWAGLSAAEQASVAASVNLLKELGPHLAYPHSSAVATSRYRHLRELRVQHRGRPYRILYAFDPRRIAVLRIGGDRTGIGRWYERYVPIADRLYEARLRARDDGGGERSGKG
jgi:hypothetical protein